MPAGSAGPGSGPWSRSWPAALAIVVGATLALGACSRNDPPAAGPGSTTSNPDRESPGTTEVPPEAGTQVFAYTPTIGDCFDRRRATDGTSRQYILTVDCGLPHSFEVFAIVDIPDTTYPGEGMLATLAKKQCPKAWIGYVGEPYESSKLELAFEAPSRNNWSLTLNHSLACLVKAPGDATDTHNKLVGSKRNSRE